MNAEDPRLVNDEQSGENKSKKNRDTVRVAGAMAGLAGVGAAAGAGAHAAYAATVDAQVDEDLDLEAVDLAEGAAAVGQTETAASAQPASGANAHQNSPSSQPQHHEDEQQPIAGEDEEVSEEHTDNVTDTRPEVTEPLTPDEIEADDNAIDEILAVEEMDVNDIEGEEIFNFDDIGTVYTVDGEEFTAASFHLDNGLEGVMIDVDGDGVFDEMAANTTEGLVSIGEAPAITVDDVELELNPDETYLAQNDEIDHTLAEDSFMDDILDSTLV